MILLDFHDLASGPPLMAAHVVVESWCRLGVLGISPLTYFCKNYHPTLSGNSPAVFLHRFPGRTRPQRAPRAPLTKNHFFFTLLLIRWSSFISRLICAGM